MTQTRFPWRLFSRIILIQSVLVMAGLAASGLAARHFFKREFTRQAEAQLRVTVESLARNLPEKTGPDWCSRFFVKDELRLTAISDDGRVVCDSHHDPATMESHVERPEFVAALREGFGSAVRSSATIHQDLLYAAVARKSHRVVIRGAVPLSKRAAALRVFDASLAVFLLVVAGVLGAFAIWSGRSLAFPIGRLLVKAQRPFGSETDERSETFAASSYGELSDLEDSLDNIRRDLEAKAERLSLEREEHATIMSAISDAILAVDKDGAPLFYNSRFVLLFGQDGLRSRESRLWQMFRDPEVLDAFKSALAGGGPSSLKAVPFEHAGTRKYFSISLSSLRRKNGGIYGAVGIFHDVTDLKRAEQIRIDFVANVSHELRTPLTAIKGYTDTLAQDVAQGKAVAKEFIEVISRNTARLMSLISDLLDISSLESNVEDLHKTSVSTEEITGRVLKQMEGVFQAKNQKISAAIGVPMVMADSRRLEQVLVNLIDNASKYTPPGGKIVVAWEAAERGAVVLKVTDTGPGIPPEHHSRLFERFYRVDKARSRELGGTGLGLAIVKHIMQRHDGSAGVESQLGRGATFVCRFPRGA